MNETILFKEEGYAIQEAIFEVYREMGCGFLESVYQECLEIEFRQRSIPFSSQQNLALVYKGQRLTRSGTQARMTWPNAGRVGTLGGMVAVRGEEAVPYFDCRHPAYVSLASPFLQPSHDLLCVAV
ncbi:MAG: GxxExxY protein [Pirellula sp.]|jgi:hypothetical protein|nr:GxxExxY protein [Pirellula sp.]